MSCPIDCPAAGTAASIFNTAAAVNLCEWLKISPLMGHQDSSATAALVTWDFCIQRCLWEHRLHTGNYEVLLLYSKFVIDSIKSVKKNAKMYFSKIFDPFVILCTADLQAGIFSSWNPSSDTEEFPALTDMLAHLQEDKSCINFSPRLPPPIILKSVFAAFVQQEQVCLYSNLHAPSNKP